jgi:hypothetical protein
MYDPAPGIFVCVSTALIAACSRFKNCDGGQAVHE